MTDYIRVIGVKDIAPGSGHVTEMNGQSIAIFNVDGTFFALTTPVPIVAVRSARENSTGKS